MSLQPESSRLDYLDATRAFALLLGILFHAGLSFLPMFIGWAVMDVSTSTPVGMFCVVSHAFRMELFFLLAGFFGHATFHRKGAGEFARTRVLRLAVPFVVGWFLLRPLIVSGWIMGSASLRGDFEFWPSVLLGFQSHGTLPKDLFTGTHLWFLYYLMLITALALGIRAALSSAGSWYVAFVSRADAFIAWLADSRFSLPILTLAASAVLWFMRGWGVDTPDRTLEPSIPVLTLYGGFFGLGWMLSRQRELIPRFSRLAPTRWILASIGVAGTLLLVKIQFDAGHPRRLLAHIVFTLCYALMMWSLVFLTIGVFRKLCHRSNPVVRYLADSSYWLYLLHLPIVVWLQVAVAEVSLHWSLKIAFIFFSTVALSLLTYDILVRSTFIGWILSGQRRERALPRLVFRTAAPPMVPSKRSAGL